MIVKVCGQLRVQKDLMVVEVSRCKKRLVVVEACEEFCVQESLDGIRSVKSCR